ncbi:tRNA uridine-5-carboxymethylaminomethyl(34) synthesis GTPase MnmE [Ruminiclostridium cellulolyticum]|uniref:tRNA modification GTPase MnmE n=1 Tax=Ruminiclostridium cellulolyticum (strain ATCC 35319 / DSM 5812 / JCM 6584 / H10) TaxID=394503 RepID=B8I2B0_RUMCH|nr:tRNA uridine-5-carboxymethylaminomethyl(34) synthesis GTPase MnmE [Ruminiclostridium cellulolyticum]ACL77773.1 tRNA modification GTPase TrmE [Ruminiclostridium cellulolyticum H10]
MYIEDTIAALSTPYGTGGIGVIRISGGQAFDTANKIFRSSKTIEEIHSHTVTYGKIVDPKLNDVVDEVLLLKMCKPNTFTREDVIEIHCHGGIVVVNRVLELIFKNGVRPAQPGEFTKRAFLNGRIDLSQAEAIIDLINSKTVESSKAAVSHLEGRLSLRLKSIREVLVGLLAHIEVTVDYPEHDIEEITGENVLENLIKIKEELITLAGTFERGKILREGIDIVIAGKPNVGKSSLLNQLSGSTKAIVTDIPGTTRDIIEEYVNIKGIPAKIIDTAGIRSTEDVVETIGVNRAYEAIESADLIIAVLSADTGVTEEDIQILKMIKNKKSLILINKTDLVEKNSISKIKQQLSECDIVLEASVIKDVGIEELETAISGLFIKGDISSNNEVLLTNARHKYLVDRAINDIEQALNSFETGMPLDMVTIDIKSCADSIGEITGESIDEAVLHNIFSRFCIGK